MIAWVRRKLYDRGFRPAPGDVLFSPSLHYADLAKVGLAAMTDQLGETEKSNKPMGIRDFCANEFPCVEAMNGNCDHIIKFPTVEEAFMLEKMCDWYKRGSCVWVCPDHQTPEERLLTEYPEDRYARMKWEEYEAHGRSQQK